MNILNKKHKKNVGKVNNTRKVTHIIKANLYQAGKVQPKQLVIILVLVMVTALSAFFLLRDGSNTTKATGDDGHGSEHEHGQSTEDDGHGHGGVANDGHNDGQNDNHDHNEAESDKIDDHKHGTGGGESKSDTTAQAEGDAGEEGISLTAKQIEQANISIMVAGSKQVRQLASFLGEIKQDTDSEAHLSTPLAGQVLRSSISLGQAVQKGQALATLLVPEIISAQQNIKRSEAELKLAEANYRREKTLWKQGIAAKQDYLQAENAWTQAKISRDSARQTLSAYRNQVGDGGHFVLRAPISGTVTQKDITIGETVLPGSDLLTVSRLDSLWVEFPVSANAIDNIGIGDDIKVSAAGENLSAKVIAFTPAADAATRQLIVRAKLTQASSRLRPNMSANVQVASSYNELPIAVDTRALQEVDGKTVVFVRSPSSSNNDQNMTFTPVQVTLSDMQYDGFTEVTSGVSEGMNYVVDGSFALKSELEKSEATHAH